MKLLKIALFIISAATLAACGSSAAPSVGAIGTTANVGSIKLTLQQFNDPAHGAGANNAPPAGNRYVAIQFQMSNPAPEAQGLNASDVAVVGSNGQIYASYYGNPLSVTGCHSFTDPSSSLTPLSWTVGSNATVSDCTVFELPTGVEARQIVWGFGGGFLPLSSTTHLWTISH